MIHKPSNKLQLKTGTGTVNPQIIQSAQEFITNNNVDFVPMGREYLDTIGRTIEAYGSDKMEMGIAHLKVTKAVMEFKANSTIFGYGLIGDLSNILLNLMEDYEHIDKDLMSIIQAYHNTVAAIFNGKMTGNGGKTGKILFGEFQAACLRYTKRN